MVTGRSIRSAIAEGRAFMLVSPIIGEYFPPEATSPTDLAQHAREVFGNTLDETTAEVHQVFGFSPYHTVSDPIGIAEFHEGTALVHSF